MFGNNAGVATKTFVFPPDLYSIYGQVGLIWSHRFLARASIQNLPRETKIPNRFKRNTFTPIQYKDRDLGVNRGNLVSFLGIVSAGYTACDINHHYIASKPNTNVQSSVPAALEV